jgi:hypothetical protein
VTAAHEWLPSNCASNSSFANRCSSDCFAGATLLEAFLLNVTFF